MQMKKGKISELERQKNFFSITLFLIFLLLAWVTSWVVIFSSRYHHSLLFNPWGDRYEDNVYGTWICVILHGLIIAVFWLSNKLKWIANKFSQTASYKALSGGDAKEGSFAQILLQAAVPQEDIDEEYYTLEEEEEGEEEEEEPESGPEKTPVCVGMLLQVLWRLSTERHAYRCAPDPSSIRLVVSRLSSTFLFLQKPRSIDINPGSISPGAGDYLGYLMPKATAAPANQGIMFSMPPPIPGENIHPFYTVSGASEFWASIRY